MSFGPWCGPAIMSLVIIHDPDSAAPYVLTYTDKDGNEQSAPLTPQQVEKLQDPASKVADVDHVVRDALRFPVHPKSPWSTADLDKLRDQARGLPPP